MCDGLLQVKHIRSQYGEYFGITVAGYPGSNSLFPFGHIDMLVCIMYMSMYILLLYVATVCVSSIHCACV